MTTPFLSVLIDTCSYERFIGEAIQLAPYQTWTDRSVELNDH